MLVIGLCLIVIEIELMMIVISIDNFGDVVEVLVGYVLVWLVVFDYYGKVDIYCEVVEVV